MTLDILVSLSTSLFEFRRHLLTLMMNGAPEAQKTVIIGKILADIAFAKDFMERYPAVGS